MDAGYLLAARCGIDSVASLAGRHKISAMMKRAVREIGANEEIVALRVTELHSEALRVAGKLTRLGVQCRLTANDFILLRVASPKDVGNFLTRFRIPIENLDGYPMMRRYLRYQLGSSQASDRLLEAFQRMPAHYYRMATFDHRGMVVRRGAERVAEPVGESRMKRAASDRVQQFGFSADRLTEIR